MKWVGLVFIIASAGSMGFRIARSLRKRSIEARQLLQALQILRGEIAFCGTPLPQAFALMAVSCQGELETVFSGVAKEMDRHSWIPPEEAFQNLPERPKLETEIFLDELFRNLGKFDLDAQLASIEHCRIQVQQKLDELEQECGRKSKTYETLGICAGLAAAILLI